MIARAWVLIKDTVSGFIEHEDLTRGAAIAYYTIFSIAPLLIIVIAIAGLVFGHDAAEGAIVGQLSGLIARRRNPAVHDSKREPSGCRNTRHDYRDRHVVADSDRRFNRDPVRA